MRRLCRAKAFMCVAVRLPDGERLASRKQTPHADGCGGVRDRTQPREFGDRSAQLTFRASRFGRLCLRLSDARLGLCALGLGTLPDRPAFRSGFLVNDLPHPIKLLVNLDLRAFDAVLTQVDRVAQERAALLDSVRVTPLLHLNSFGLKELAQVLEEFAGFDWLHSSSSCRQRRCSMGSTPAITERRRDCNLAINAPVPSAGSALSCAVLVPRTIPSSASFPDLRATGRRGRIVAGQPARHQTRSWCC